ncbi:unnamed protein product, partial [Didymodactylos carnosus]
MKSGNSALTSLASNIRSVR